MLPLVERLVATTNIAEQIQIAEALERIRSSAALPAIEALQANVEQQFAAQGEPNPYRLVLKRIVKTLAQSQRFDVRYHEELLHDARRLITRLDRARMRKESRIAKMSERLVRWYYRVELMLPRWLCVEDRTVLLAHREAERAVVQQAERERWLRVPRAGTYAELVAAYLLTKVLLEIGRVNEQVILDVQPKWREPLNRVHFDMLNETFVLTKVEQPLRSDIECGKLTTQQILESLARNFPGPAHSFREESLTQV